MNKIIILAAAVALCLSSCGPKIQKVTLEPMPMLYGDSSRTVLPFSKDPTVIRKGNEYMMYYSIKSYEKTVSPEPAHNGWDTGIARSTDLVNWTRVCDLDLRDSKGNKIYGAVAPCVKVIDGQIHMFYQRMWEKANNNNIWHATSEDGITFTNTCDTPVFVPETSWSINRSIDAEVYRVKDKMILMFGLANLIIGIANLLSSRSINSAVAVFNLLVATLLMYGVGRMRGKIEYLENERQLRE